MAKLTITGNTEPIVGNTEVYSLSVFNNIMTSNSFGFLSPKVQWNIHVKDKKGWRLTNGNLKEGERVTYKFTDKSLQYIALKIEAVRGEDRGELYIRPKAAVNPKIIRVELLDVNSQRIPKGKLLHYTDTIIARAYCVGMFGQKVSFTLWEDDAAGKGHSPVINMMNRINPVPLIGEVDYEGVAKVVFRLPAYTMAVQIANAGVARGDQSEGKTHEYYVTAEIVSKHILKASPNVNVINPTHIPLPSVPGKPNSGDHTPASQKVPEAPGNHKGKSDQPKPGKETAKFPQTPAAKNQTDSEGKILSAEFTDGTGKSLKSARTGDMVSIKIISQGMRGKNVLVRIWEEDLSRYSHDLLYEETVKLLYDTSFINSITLTKEMYKKANEWGEGNNQEYFIEVEHLKTSVTSMVIPIHPAAKPVKVEANDSVVIIKEPKKERTGSCICQEQYKDLIWGGKVSCEFRKKVVEICSELWGEGRKMEMANGLMAVMKVETWGSFKAHHREGYKSANDDPKDLTVSSFHKESTKSSRAVGLIQFTQDALEGMGEFPKSTSAIKGMQSRFDALNKLKLSYAQMGEIDQLNKVKKYFEPAKNRIKTPEDIYLHVFAPKGVGQKDDFLLYPKDTIEYINNESVDKDNNGIQRKEILARFYKSKKDGADHKISEFTCKNVTQAPKTNNNTSDSGFYIYKDGSIKYIKGTESISYYIQVKSGSNEFKKLYTLTKNSYGLIKFPDAGDGFGRYGPVDTGGNSSIENVGKGDHYLLPQTAAALLGIISEIKDKNWTIKLGDMSSENGSDPTSNPSKAKTHHAGHGHKGRQSGLNIDFRYLDKDGKSFQGLSSDAVFDDSKNKIFFEIAFKYGFNKNYASGKSYSGVNPKVGGHYDHGHIGALAIKFETVEKIDVKIIQ